MQLGPTAATTFRRMARDWKQGEHVLVSGSTGSGKTTLARYLDEIRIRNGGHVIVFFCKLTPDETITTDYKGFTRWKEYRKPTPRDKKILLWPDTSKEKTLPEKLAKQRAVFTDALNKMADGYWTLHVDDGLYFCAPEFLNLKQELAMLHAMGRSSKLTIITLTQRPSHIPLIIYSSASYAFIGRTRERVDVQRLGELGGKESAKEMSARIDSQGRHDFLYVPVATDGDTETVNLKR